MEATPGHHLVAAAEQETVRPAPMAKAQSSPEMRLPASCLLASNKAVHPVQEQVSPARRPGCQPSGLRPARHLGSQTGGQNVLDISIPELVKSSSNTINGSSANWPINLPQTGSQTEYKLNVPYRFFGLTESLSWLAQFEGQGFEDISALNLHLGLSVATR